jgi:serine/threonine-protein kinase
MTRCQNCTTEIPDNAVSCPTCGTEASPAADSHIDKSIDKTELFGSLSAVATRRPNAAQQPTQPQASISFDSNKDNRFVAGTILAERYRIVGLLGRGGMGEVYRADDLKLGQPVALKFLPDDLRSDGAALARFHREVRIARQVSHKNVCRVYDIGEIEGRQFLSMEYIKGEELSSLLRRIGRLPADKAIQVARQICAGLAAAHDIGVLHRDLKPSNIMIDDHGNARITDFGLAGLTEDFQDDELTAGTPAYMAPEQFDGTELTVRTDIYSLGLLLYELFTGRRAFEAANLRELVELRRGNTTPKTPTSIVKDLDPLVEKVIDRCMQKDPALRPASALQVAAALPGGDPIAAALAAGETPSPEMVVAASSEGALRPAMAIALFTSFVAVLVLGCWLAKYTQLYRMTPLEKPPEVLQDRAHEILAQAGYPGPGIDNASAMFVNTSYLQYVSANDRSGRRWDKLKSDPTAGYRYWFRQSPRSLVPPEGVFIDFDQPAQNVSGMAGVYLDMAGHLHYFIGVPPQRDDAQGGSAKTDAPFDWSKFFTEAGLDQSAFHPVASTWVPPQPYESRAAWDGKDLAHPDYNVHIEAATFRGRPVYFETIYPWDHPARQEEVSAGAGWQAAVSISIVVFVLALVGSAVLAFKNLRFGRGDRRGAFRLASFYLLMRMLLIVDVHHVTSFSDEFGSFIKTVSNALFGATFLWVLYVALEPFVRRYWPERIISWSRLLVADWRDPLVGRDVLIGALVGTVASRFFQLGTLLQMRLASSTGGFPLSTFDSPFLGLHFFVFKFTHYISSTLFVALFLLFLLLVFFILVRRERVAAAAVGAVVTGLLFLIFGGQLSSLPFALAIGILMVGVLYRYGLLASISASVFYFLPVYFPHTTDLTAWYATDFTLAAIILIALVAGCTYTSLAGQRVFKGGLLRD